jgi:hypothetical protein
MAKPSIFLEKKVIKEIAINEKTKIGEIIKLASPETVELEDNLEDQEVYLLDQEEELSKDAKALDAKDHKAFVVHRCKKIRVVVEYNGHTFSHDYAPSRKVQQIRHNAIKQLNVDEIAGKNLELFEKANDQNSKMNRSYPIGYYTSYPTCGITLYLADPNAFAG